MKAEESVEDVDIFGKPLPLEVNLKSWLPTAPPFMAQNVPAENA